MTPAVPTVARRAIALAGAGRAAEGAALLEGAAEDDDALLVLALWRLEGRFLPRDAAASRALLERAAAREHRGAARILGGFRAAGVGGARDWDGALRLLAAWAARDPVARSQHELIAAMALDPAGDPLAVAGPEILSEAPYVARLPGLLTPAECDFLIGLAEPRLKPARIFHEGKGRFVEDPLRRSDAAGFPLVSEWPAVHALNRRLARAGGSDVARGETLQVLRYAPGQEYRPHLDAVPGLVNQRETTVLVWLNEDYGGGETVFDRIGVTVRGRIGDALVFRNILADARPDPASRHAGTPVTAGRKYLASRWIRQKALSPEESKSYRPSASR